MKRYWFCLIDDTEEYFWEAEDIETAKQEICDDFEISEDEIENMEEVLD